MTATTTRAARGERRVRLLDLIHRATVELIDLERAEHRSAKLTATVIEPPAHELPSTRTQRVRAWARAQGLPIGDAGRIQASILTAYAQAHPEDAAP